MISTNNPLIFIIIALTISLAWALILFFRYLRSKGKHILHVFAALLVALLMGIAGIILGLITNSGPLLTTVYAIGLGFMGVVIYLTMELIEKLRKM
jgi:hypothetical protein